MRKMRQQMTKGNLNHPAREPAGEARGKSPTGVEARAAINMPNNSGSVGEGPTMEEVLERENMLAAYKRVKSNKGSPGPDGMSVEELSGYLKQQWPDIRDKLLAGTYQPQAVRRVSIPKPTGGERELGIPSVLDRLIQQAMLQVMQRRWDESFSEHSYGFRPGRSAHQAVAAAQAAIRQGRAWVVDLDVEKFFDRVNHDILMGKLAKRVSDKRILGLVRRYLEAGAILPTGVLARRQEGTPQGGPLSPLLANVLLDELDKELERRKHCVVRYADDCNIYVRSQRAGERVMQSVKRFLTTKLKLRINDGKSAVARAEERTFLGFRCTAGARSKRLIAPEALDRAKRRLRPMTARKRGGRLEEVMRQVRVFLAGWWGYFRFTQMPQGLGLIGWVRRRLRQLVWTRWKTPRNRIRQMVKLGCSRRAAREAALSNAGPWRSARHPGLHTALNNAYWRKLGLPDLEGIANTA